MVYMVLATVLIPFCYKHFLFEELTGMEETEKIEEMKEERSITYITQTLSGKQTANMLQHCCCKCLELLRSGHVSFNVHCKILYLNLFCKLASAKCTSKGLVAF